MPVVKLKTGEVGCRKPDCKHRMELTHRHHRRCETLFVTAFRELKISKRYTDLCTRYEKFDGRDTLRICAWHHAEIHVLYDGLILDFKIKINKVLFDFTWDEADKLMRNLRKACYAWEAEVTPGINPALVFGKQRYRVRHPDKKRKKRERSRKRRLNSS